MNVVEQAYAAMEARKAETGGGGSFQTADEWRAENEEREERPVERPERRLGGTRYADLFRHSLDPQRIEFFVGEPTEEYPQGRPCWVDLVPMGRDARAAIANRFDDTRTTPQGTLLREYTIELVSATVVDFQLWDRPRSRETGELQEWQAIRAAPDPKQRRQQWEQMTDALLWWGDLVGECQRINEADPGN